MKLLSARKYWILYWIYIIIKIISRKRNVFHIIIDNFYLIIIYFLIELNITNGLMNMIFIKKGLD